MFEDGAGVLVLRQEAARPPREFWWKRIAGRLGNEGREGVQLAGGRQFGPDNHGSSQQEAMQVNQI